MKNLNQWQTSIHDWVCHTLGQPSAFCRKERSDRFMEEALELVQAAGMSREDVLTLVDYTYSRSQGEVRAEAGDALLCLLALISAHELVAEKTLDDTMARAWRDVEKIRAKNKTKPKSGPLPGVSPEEHHNALHRINRT